MAHPSCHPLARVEFNTCGAELSCSYLGGQPQLTGDGEQCLTRGTVHVLATSIA